MEESLDKKVVEVKVYYNITVPLCDLYYDNTVSDITDKICVPVQREIYKKKEKA